jgi:hypothetical protein
LALMAIAPVRAQNSAPVPAAPRPVTPPAFPAVGGSLPPALVTGGSQATPPPAPGVEPLPQSGPHAAGPVLDHGPIAEAPEEDGYSFRGLYFTGDYLLLRPARNALDYAIQSTNLTQTPGGVVESADWHTESGFRVGTGFRIPGQDWTFGITYMNISSHDNEATAAPAGGTLYATLTRGGSFDQVDTASAFSNLTFNVIDLDFSHRIKCSDCFNLTVFGGGRFAWINQELNATYNGGPDHATNDNVSTPVFFNGAGLTIGGQGEWSVWHGVSLYARARGSLLSGQFRDSVTETTNNNSVVIVNVSEKFDQIVPVAEMGLGLSYCCEHWHVSVGYELQNWFGMVNSLDFADASNIGKPSRRTSDLSLEGLAVQLGLAF